MAASKNYYGLSCISQFFILNPRGDTIIAKDYRADLPRTTAEVFFREVRFYKGSERWAPPIFRCQGVNYMYKKLNDLIFVFTSKSNTTPSLFMEALHRLTVVFKDYCGVLTEESIRKNFILIYELLDEIMDFGYIQGTSTELLKAYVMNEPSSVSKSSGMMSGFADRFAFGRAQTVAADAVNKTVSENKKNEIFVDIFEHITCTFNANGVETNSSIDGHIQMKSYLAGNPKLRLALNEDLVIGNAKQPQAATGMNPQYGQVKADDILFHHCVNLDEWPNHRTILFQPPDGEFCVLLYRMTSTFRSPFRIFPFFELIKPGFQVEIIVKIRADIPEQNYGGNVEVSIPMPETAQSVRPEVGVGVTGQTANYETTDKTVTWKIKKFLGGTEEALRIRITFPQKQQPSIRKNIGPIAMKFEIPMFNVSNLQVRYLRLTQQGSKPPCRWVRYVTKSNSYVCRL